MQSLQTEKYIMVESSVFPSCPFCIETDWNLNDGEKTLVILSEWRNPLAFTTKNRMFDDELMYEEITKYIVMIKVLDPTHPPFKQSHPY